MLAPVGGPGSPKGQEKRGREQRSCGAKRWRSLGTLAKGAWGLKPIWCSAFEAMNTPTWSTSTMQRPRGTHGTQGQLRGPANALRGASTRNESTRIVFEWRLEQCWLGARRIVWCASTEPAKPCNPATTHMLSRTLDRNTTKCTLQRHAARPVVYEEASSGAKFAPLGVKDNTTKPCAYKDGSSSRRGPMVAMGLALHSNGWNKHHSFCKSVPKLCQACMAHQPHIGTTRDIKGHCCCRRHCCRCRRHFCYHATG